MLLNIFICISLFFFFFTQFCYIYSMTEICNDFFLFENEPTHAQNLWGGGIRTPSNKRNHALERREKNHISLNLDQKRSLNEENELSHHPLRGFFFYLDYIIFFVTLFFPLFRVKYWSVVVLQLSIIH